MKAKQSITASVALVAFASAWIARKWQDAIHREMETDEKCQREAIETLEGEGGIVVA